MELKGKVNVFVKDVKGKDGKDFKTFRASFGSKNQDGKYLNASMPLKFAGEKMTRDKTNKLLESHMYVLDVVSGFIGVDQFKNKDGNTYNEAVIVITDAKVDSKKEIAKKEEKDNDTPF